MLPSHEEPNDVQELGAVDGEILEEISSATFNSIDETNINLLTTDSATSMSAVPLPTPAFPFTFTSKDKMQWRHVRNTECPNTTFINDENYEEVEIDSAFSYFSRYLTPDFFKNVQKYTNIYAVRNNPMFKQCTLTEIQTVFAIHLMIGVLKFPRIHMFWNKNLGISFFTDNMSLKRFFSIRNHLHLVDANERAPNCTDRLFKVNIGTSTFLLCNSILSFYLLLKVRPIIEAVRIRCLDHKLEENLCIDEQIIPFKGQINIKQYIKSKPYPWGIKVFVLCGKSGIPYDFIVYQGSTTPLDNEMVKKIGFSSAIVLHLAQRIPANVIGRKLYFDNYFSSYAVFEALLERKIFSAGTVRLNRFPNTLLLSDTELKKKGRGASDQCISRDEKVILTKWYDNKSVNMGSNFIGIGSTDRAKRFDKKTHTYVEIDRPEVIKLYNENMGGVDLLDQMLQYYRIFIRSKKWTLRVITHFLDLATVAAWMEYRADCLMRSIPKKNIMDSMAFRIEVANSLVSINKSGNRKVGRPSHTADEADEPEPKKKCSHQFAPPKDVRLDQIGHFPLFSSAKSAGRCKKAGCEYKSFILCEKCKIYLCLNRERNCFLAYHTL